MQKKQTQITSLWNKIGISLWYWKSSDSLLLFLSSQIFNERRFFEPANEEQDLHELEMHFVDYQDTDDSHLHQEHTQEHYTRKLQNILGRKVSAQKIHNAAPKTEELAFLHSHRFGQQQQQLRLNDGFNHFPRQEEETARGGHQNFEFEPRPPPQQQPSRRIYYCTRAISISEIFMWQLSVVMWIRIRSNPH